MNKIIFLLLISSSSFAQNQAKTIIVHGDSLWLKNMTTGDSTPINKTGLFMKYADTANALAAYQTAINGKQVAGSYATTTQNALKVNISDTASMLSGYLRSITAASTYALPNAVNTNSNTYADGKVQNSLSASTTIAPSATAVNTALVLKNDVITNGSIFYNKLVLTGAILNADLAGSIDLTTKVTGLLPFANTGGSTAATSATTGTMTVNMTTPIITITPTAACTFNASGGVTGQRITFVVTTSGVSSFVITFGTNFKSTATLATGTTTGKIFTVSFLCTNSTQWVETGRTAAQ